MRDDLFEFYRGAKLICFCVKLSMHDSLDSMLDIKLSS